MFTCANRGETKSDEARGAVGVIGGIGFFLATRSTWWPAVVCSKCSRQVRLFGLVSLVIMGMLLVMTAHWWLR